MVWSLLIVRPYIGERFIIRTDHDCIKGTLNMEDATGKLALWRLHMSEFEFSAIHRAKIKHQAANALSGIRANDTDTTLFKGEMPIAVMVTTSLLKNKTTLQLVCNQTVANVAENNDGFQEGAGGVPMLEKCLRQ